MADNGKKVFVRNPGVASADATRREGWTGGDPAWLWNQQFTGDRSQIGTQEEKALTERAYSSYQKLPPGLQNLMEFTNVYGFFAPMVARASISTDKAIHGKAPVSEAAGALGELFLNAGIGIGAKGLTKMREPVTTKDLKKHVWDKQPERPVTEREYNLMQAELERTGNLEMRKTGMPYPVRRYVNAAIEPYSYNVKYITRDLLTGNTMNKTHIGTNFENEFYAEGGIGAKSMQSLRGVQNRYDAWKIYMNLPQRNNTFRINPHSTTKTPTFAVNERSYNNPELTSDVWFLEGEGDNAMGIMGAHDITIFPTKKKAFNKIQFYGRDGPRSKFIPTASVEATQRDRWDLQPFKSHLAQDKVARTIGAKLQKLGLSDIEVGKFVGGRPFQIENRFIMQNYMRNEQLLKEANDLQTRGKDFLNDEAALGLRMRAIFKQDQASRTLRTDTPEIVFKRAAKPTQKELNDLLHSIY